jgi:hypothetical protein
LDTEKRSKILFLLKLERGISNIEHHAKECKNGGGRLRKQYLTIFYNLIDNEAKSLSVFNSLLS